MAEGRWQGMDSQEAIVELERRLANAKQFINSHRSAMRAALLILGAEATEESREQARRVLERCLAEHPESATKLPKRARRRAKRQAAQAHELAASI
jgi:hypothetical protein